MSVRLPNIHYITPHVNDNNATVNMEVHNIFVLYRKSKGLSLKIYNSHVLVLDILWRNLLILHSTHIAVVSLMGSDFNKLLILKTLWKFSIFCNIDYKTLLLINNYQVLKMTFNGYFFLIGRSSTTSGRWASSRCSSWTVTYSWCTQTERRVRRTPPNTSPPASSSTAARTPL